MPTTQRDGNWGRWGADDERGALNFVTPEAVLAATRVCTTGKCTEFPLAVGGLTMTGAAGSPINPIAVG